MPPVVLLKVFLELGHLLLRRQLLPRRLLGRGRTVAAGFRLGAGAAAPVGLRGSWFYVLRDGFNVASGRPFVT
jgi:hypothetical protein